MYRFILTYYISLTNLYHPFVKKWVPQGQGLYLSCSLCILGA